MKLCVCTALSVCLLAAACSGEPGEHAYYAACTNGIAAADHELESARAAGIGDSVKWTKAASMIGAAKVQQTFEEYQNCAVKARQAQTYLREMRG